jgi:excisionase family DNA binding protein
MAFVFTPSAPASSTTTERFIGVELAARLVGVSPNAIRSWAIRGQIPAHKTPGGHWRFRKSELYEALQIPTCGAAGERTGPRVSSSRSDGC